MQGDGGLCIILDICDRNIPNMNNNNGQGPLAGIIRGVGDSLSGAVNTLSQGGSIRDVVSSVNQQRTDIPFTIPNLAKF